VEIYVLDTGCRTSHTELRGRASIRSVVLKDGSVPWPTPADGAGHGTHVAALAAGSVIPLLLHTK
jgi:subtilisin family serine protease